MPKAKKSEKKAGKLDDIKSDFITVASHQLRTPISGIRWSLDTLLSGRAGQLTPKQHEVAAEAYQNNQFMVKVVNDLLRVSRFEEKGLNLQPQLVNIVPIIKEILQKYQSVAKAFHCDIEVSIEKKLPKVY